MRETRLRAVALLGVLCIVLGSIVLVLSFNTSARYQTSVTPSGTPTNVPSALGQVAVPLAPTFDPRLPIASQTRDGITLRVQVRSADLNRIVLSCIADGPPHSYFSLDDLDWAHLTANGTDLPSLDFGEMGIGGCGGQAMPGEPILYSPNTLNYDASVLNITSDTITLELKAPIIVSHNLHVPPVPVPTDAPGIPTATTAPPTPIPPPDKVLTFTVGLQTPIERRCRVAQVNKTAEALGIKMMLNYVSVTASETRIKIRYLGDERTLLAFANASLHPGPGAAAIEIESDRNSSGDYKFSLLGQSLLDTNAGEWTMTVNSLFDDAAPPMPPIVGPWTFHFTMPPATICSSVPAPVGTSTP